MTQAAVTLAGVSAALRERRSEAVGSTSQATGVLGDGDRLQSFLSTSHIVQGLRLWFGDGKLLEPPCDRNAILSALDRDIAYLDRLLSEQVDAILHHTRFQKLEASWRGVDYLVDQSDDEAGVKIKLLDISWAEVTRDMERAIEFDQSQLFTKIYENEFGMPGGEPYGVLIGDYEVRHKRGKNHPTDDVSTMKSLAQVAAAAFSPLIVGAAPELLGLDSFRDLGIPLDLSAVFKQPEYDRWRSLRELEDSRFIGVTLPRILMRLPYRDGAAPDYGFRYIETVSGNDDSRYLWGSAAYAFGGVLIRNFFDSGWFADIRGAARDVVGYGLVPGLTVQSFGTDRRGIAIKYSSDVSISEIQEMELSNLGFIPLSKCSNSEFSVFYSNQSVQKPQTFDRASANVNARLSAMLQYILCVSRFSHYVKVMGRDRVGSFISAEECQDFLQRWLLNYCSAVDGASPEQKAKYPLREGQVAVRETPGRPGVYACTVHLQPHAQLDQVISTFKLVTELSSVGPA
ncbi:type VI secretion system contractile sheath large subunit [Pelagibius sp. Alg239-R121]|uniref:type VI secretion system contractile sheath large subunit n=1 Tax=Pelagibius sp. Alg239-R121 TaxID=2993448 RepID=UPI0024A6E05F|nr:type VI secretion system contractile sheath large subunit [Pelagibius sp. Alg239-R121]